MGVGCKMTTEELLELLENVKQVGPGRWLAQCPAHDDHVPSLSIAEGEDGRTLLHCFAGCSTEDICRTLGISLRDLFEDSGGNGLTLEEIAKVKKIPLDFLKSLHLSTVHLDNVPCVRIPYFDEDGQEVAVRLRFALNGANRFRWKSGSKTFPYGLWRLKEAKKKGWILLVEGESDCWTLWFYGLPALGIPGKSTWRPEWGEYLRDLKVYLWQEPDALDLVERVAKDIPDLLVIPAPPGIKDPSEAHCQGIDVAKLLEDLQAKAIPAIEVFKGRQNAFRLEESTLKREILGLIRRFTEGRLSLEHFFREMERYRQMVETTLPEPIPQEALFTNQYPEGIWGSTFFRGAIHLLASDPGVGKTTLAYVLAVSLAEGRDFLGERLPRLRVAYFDLETPQSLRGVKLRALEYGGGKNLLFFDVSCPIEALKALVKRYGIEFLIIDTVSLFFALKKEEDNAEVNTTVVQPLKAFTKETGVAVLLIHHNSKGAKERSKVYKSRGASALPAGCDVVLNLENTEDPDVLRLEVAKNRISGYMPKLYLQKVEGNFTITEKPDSEFTKTQKVEQAILQLLKTQGTTTPGWLANAIAFACKKTVQRALQNLLVTGKVVKVGRGEYTLPEKGQGKDMHKSDVPNVPKCLKPASQAEKNEDMERDMERDMSPSMSMEGQKGHDTPPHIKGNALLRFDPLSLMSLGTPEGHVPIDVPNDVPTPNPHGKRIPGTKGQKGHHSHTCPFHTPNPSDTDGVIYWAPWSLKTTPQARNQTPPSPTHSLRDSATPCPVCIHPQRDEIEYLYDCLISPKRLGERYGLDPGTITVHMEQHRGAPRGP